MNIAYMYSKKADTGLPPEKVFSVELYPPQNGHSLDERIQLLKDCGVAYVSVTHPARNGIEKTLPLAAHIQNTHRIPVLMHLTCVPYGREQIERIVNEALRQGIENILALRGDIPIPENGGDRQEGHFRYASDLVNYLAEVRRKIKYAPCIGVACHPQGHPEAPSKKEDLQSFRYKVNCGADFAITQMVFDVETYKNFTHQCSCSCNCHSSDDLSCPSGGPIKIIPIIPGVFPLRSRDDLTIVPQRFGISLPPEIEKETKNLSERKFEEWSENYTVWLVKKLLTDAHAPGVHFFSMNGGERIANIIKHITDPGARFPLGLG